MSGRLRGLGRQLLALPSVGWTALFFLAPLVLLVVYSFAKTDLLTYEISFDWTLANYSNVFQGLYLDAIVRSLILSVSATLACLLVGFPVAYTIARANGRAQLVLLFAVMVPFWTSFVVRTYGIFNLIGDSGPLARLLESLGLIGDDGLDLLFTAPRRRHRHRLLLPAAHDPAALRRAGADRPCPARRRDRPRAPRRPGSPARRPSAGDAGIFAGCILVGIPATGEYVIPQILGGGKTLMVGNVVANQFLRSGTTRSARRWRSCSP